MRLHSAHRSQKSVCVRIMNKLPVVATSVNNAPIVATVALRWRRRVWSHVPPRSRDLLHDPASHRRRCGRPGRPRAIEAGARVESASPGVDGHLRSPVVGAERAGCRASKVPGARFRVLVAGWRIVPDGRIDRDALSFAEEVVPLSGPFRRSPNVIYPSKRPGFHRQKKDSHQFHGFRGKLVSIVRFPS